MAHREHPDNLADRLTHWALTDDRIRAVILTGSRANPDASVDAFSDYDVLLFVTDSESFTHHESWLGAFGTILVQFRDERVRYGMPEHAKLVLYDDGTKVDFTIAPVAMLRLMAKESQLPAPLDDGCRVLVDKDSLAVMLPLPGYAALIPGRPTEAEFKALVEEFWWETTYVAKNLWRDELMPARYSFDSVMRYDLLRRMLEWYVEIGRSWSWKPGVLGRGMKQALPPEIWSALEKTFVDATIEETWRALFRITALFRNIANEVAVSLGYAYPHPLDERVTEYLEKIRQTKQRDT